jgi:hypothetical protein
MGYSVIQLISQILSFLGDTHQSSWKDNSIVDPFI